MYRALFQALTATVVAGWSVLAAPPAAQSQALAPEKIEQAQWSERLKASDRRPLIVKAQVLLARARFSPGVIDGQDGENFEKALRAFQEANDLEPSGKLDAETWRSLSDVSGQAIVRRYRLTKEDAQGPFVDEIPESFAKMAKLEQLAYQSPGEAIAEKFHMSEDLLTALNRQVSLDEEGVEIAVIDLPPLHVPTTGKSGSAKRDGNTGSVEPAKRGSAARVIVDKAERSVRVYDADEKMIAFYPASIGSKARPAPTGIFKVRKVALLPTYTYDPKYAFPGQDVEKPVKVAAGPNNPVGLAWIEVADDGYGIHGTPDPEHVGKTESHGCIRLTNWDAVELARLVKKGTPVEFVE